MHTVDEPVLNPDVSSPLRPVGDIVVVIFFLAEPTVYGGAAGAGYVVEEEDAASGAAGVERFGVRRLQ